MRGLAAALTAFLWISPAAPGAPTDTVHVRHTQEVYKAVGSAKLKIDIFRPEQAKDRKPTAAVVFFHGGGWAFGTPDEFFSTCEHYAQLGLIAFSVEYRLANDHGATPHPTISPIECVMDAKSAMRWVRANASRFNLAPNGIVAAGQSAGGQLALATAMIDGYDEATDDLSVSCRPDAILLFSSCVNTVEGWCDYLLGDRRTQIWNISPTHHVHGGLPPMIEFHGTVDEQVPLWTVQFFADEMKKAGNRFELRLFKGRRHYLGGDDPKYAKYFDDDILRQADDFLRNNHLLD
jgi:acetyl esterase/lipase